MVPEFPTPLTSKRLYSVAPGRAAVVGNGKVQSVTRPGRGPGIPLFPGKSEDPGRERDRYLNRRQNCYVRSGLYWCWNQYRYYR